MKRSMLRQLMVGVMGFAVCWLVSGAPAAAQQSTITFDAGRGVPPSFTESCITVTSFHPVSSRHLHLGNFGGDPSADLFNHAGCCSTPYVFDSGGQPFSVISFDVVRFFGGPHRFTSSLAATLTVTGTGTVTFPATGWTDITSFRWDSGRPNMSIDNLLVFCGRREVKVPVDIKPQSCRNPLNVNSRGVLSAAILGTASFDVTQIDDGSVQLEGVTPVRSALEDVATPFVPFTGKSAATDCTDVGPDGFLDLTLKFDAQAVVAALGTVADGDVRVLKLTGNLFSGQPIVGEDVVVILKKK